MVSIVITAYNVEEWIQKCIASACLQTYRDIEIIVVEDCSTDGTRKVLENFTDKRVRILYNTHNMGAGASRRRGIEAAQGEYIMLLDGDDWIDDDFIETLHCRAVEEDADIVSGGITIVHGNGLQEKTSYGNHTIEGKEKLDVFRNERIVFMSNKLIRRRLHSEVPYCTRRFIEDTPVMIPMLYLANKVTYIDNCGYNYRMHTSSLTHSATPFKYALFRALCAEDITAFFEAREKACIEELGLDKALTGCLLQIKECHPTAAMIEPFKDEWIEYTTKLIARLL